MIFSHFKRRRGIRFDDGFRHSARELALDPLVATYDAILATDPTVPVLLQLTEYRGQQVLWQDPECTIPVEEIGDPIGGVRHPETGEILAVQETDADRPVWGGREVGAEFDGESDGLISKDSTGFLPETGDFFVLVDPDFDQFNDQDQVISQNEANATGRIQALRFRTRPASLSSFWSELGTSPEVEFPDDPQDDDWYVAFSRTNIGGGEDEITLHLYDQHGDEVGTDSTTTSSDSVILQTNTGIAFRTDANDRHFGGFITSVIVGNDPSRLNEVVGVGGA